MANITVEENLTLRPRDGNGHALPDATVIVDDDGPTLTPNTRKVTLCIDMVGPAAERDVSRFTMTQDPFPADDRRTNVMRVQEYPKFAGAVDRFSIEGLAANAGPRTVRSLFLQRYIEN